MIQIYLTSRRVKAAGDVNACHTSASKCEEEFQKLNEQKSAQDLYLDKLSQDLEDLEQKCLDYEAQVWSFLPNSLFHFILSLATTIATQNFTKC